MWIWAVLPNDQIPTKICDLITKPVLRYGLDHKIGITRVLKHLRSLATWVFVQQLVVTTKISSRLCISDPLWGESTRFPSQRAMTGGFPSQRASNWCKQAFPCHDIIMSKCFQNPSKTCDLLTAPVPCYGLDKCHVSAKTWLISDINRICNEHNGDRGLKLAIVMKWTHHPAIYHPWWITVMEVWQSTERNFTFRWFSARLQYLHCMFIDVTEPKHTNLTKVPIK